MPLVPFPYRPIGGINLEDAEDQLGETQVQDASNFLFENKQFLTRPMATSRTLTGFTGVPIFGKSFNIDGNVYTGMVSSNGKLYKVTAYTSGAVTVTEITGAGTTFAGTISDRGAEAVNGIVLFSDNSAGMLRWDPTTAVYTIVADSNYKYVTSHVTRAVGAFILDGAPGDSRRVGWSQSADETLWTGGDSGSSNLVDLPDDITGLCVLHNVLTVIRRTGIHLGTLTGISQPVYNFEAWARDSNGCYYPPTLAVYDNVAYFCSQNDVFTFDLQNLTPIGYNIRKELLGYLKLGYVYKGCITRSVFAQNRLRYHLIPQSAGSLPQVPHFCYDLEEKVWSKHSYGFSPNGGFAYFVTSNQETLALFVQSAVFSLWELGACEQPAMLHSRSITIGDEEHDMIVRRMMIKYRNFSEYNVTLQLRGALNENMVENVITNNLGATNPGDQELYRRWFNVGLSAQDFQFILNIPAGKQFAGTYTSLETTTSAEFKGSPST